MNVWLVMRSHKTDDEPMVVFTGEHAELAAWKEAAHRQRASDRADTFWATQLEHHEADELYAAGETESWQAYGFTDLRELLDHVRLENTIDPSIYGQEFEDGLADEVEP